jgi:hypothetical protein
MAELPINANISEIDGAFYPVRLEWVPRVGELIDLWSFADEAASHPPGHRYEVVQVVHKLHDLTEKSHVAREGYHFVTVYVRPSQDGSLRSRD